MSPLREDKVIPHLIGLEDADIFDYTNESAVLLLLRRAPGEEIISQFGKGHSIEIDYFLERNIQVFRAKIGDLDWVTCPFSARLGESKANLQLQDAVFMLKVFLVDTTTGIVKANIMTPLTIEFYDKLVDEARKEMQRSWNAEVYWKKRRKILAKYNNSIES